MARTTIRTKQSPKRDRRCIVLDANLQKHWRKTHCRDRNIRNRGYDEHPDENGYDRRHLDNRATLHINENLAEAGIVHAPKHYLDEPVEDSAEYDSDDLWAETVADEDVFDVLDVRSCGCIGAHCSYDDYEPFDPYDDDDYLGESRWDDHFDTIYGTPDEDSDVA